MPQYNLSDYQKTYDKFSYDQYKGELDWFSGNRLNAAFNAVDRNAANFRKNKVALYWHGQDDQKQKFTFRELSLLSNQFGNLLKNLDVDKGGRVFFFLPRVPELYYGFLGTLKIGAIAGTLFSAFGHQALYDRLENSDAKVLVTEASLFDRVAEAAKDLPSLETILVVGEAKSIQKSEFRIQ